MHSFTLQSCAGNDGFRPLKQPAPEHYECTRDLRRRELDCCDSEECRVATQTRLICSHVSHSTFRAPRAHECQRAIACAKHFQECSRSQSPRSAQRHGRSSARAITLLENEVHGSAQRLAETGRVRPPGCAPDSPAKQNDEGSALVSNQNGASASR